MFFWHTAFTIIKSELSSRLQYPARMIRHEVFNMSTSYVLEVVQMIDQIPDSPPMSPIDLPFVNINFLSNKLRIVISVPYNRYLRNYVCDYCWIIKAAANEIQNQIHLGRVSQGFLENDFHMCILSFPSDPVFPELGVEAEALSEGKKQQIDKRELVKESYPLSGFIMIPSNTVFPCSSL